MQARHLLALLSVLLLLAACKVNLYSGLAENEANEMLAVLLTHGIDSGTTMEKAGVTLEVEEGQVARAVEVLRANGLPQQKFAGLGDVFKKEGIISSPLEERALLVYALSQEIARTISNIDGVLVARVHVVLPETVGDGNKVTPSSAAVFIKYRPNADLEMVVPQIKRLVSNAISDLNYEDVSVVLVPGEASTMRQASPFAEALSLKLAPQSVTGLRLIVGGLAFLVLLALAGNGVLIWMLRRRAQPAPAPSSAPDLSSTPVPTSDIRDAA